MLRDPVSFTMGLLLVGGLAYVVWLMVRQARTDDVTYDTRLPVSEPLSHVNVDPSGRVAKVGVDVHSVLCVDGEGRVECGCGLANREAGARMIDEVAFDRLEERPGESLRDARLRAWAELHGETGGVA